MFNLKNIFGSFYSNKDCQVEKNIGMEKSYNSADDKFKNALLDLIEDYCHSHKGQTFTVNQLRDYLVVLRANGIKTHDNRVIGAMMRKASSRGLCKKTGMSIKSKVGHYSNLQVWLAL